MGGFRFVEQSSLGLVKPPTYALSPLHTPGFGLRIEDFGFNGVGRCVRKGRVLRVGGFWNSGVSF